MSLSRARCRTGGEGPRAPLLCGLGLAAALCGAQAIAAEAPPEQAAHLVQQKCSECHPRLPGGGWQIISDKPRSRNTWRSILWRMTEEYEVTLTDAEKGVLIDGFAPPDGRPAQ